MAPWAVELRLIDASGTVVKKWTKELDQISANKLYTDQVEALRLRYPVTKP